MLSVPLPARHFAELSPYNVFLWLFFFRPFQFLVLVPVYSKIAPHSYVFAIHSISCLPGV